LLEAWLVLILKTAKCELHHHLSLHMLTSISYFMAANPSTDRHLYSAALPNATAIADGFEPQLTAITDVTRPGYFGVSFSPGGGYYVLSYRGPDVPYQKLHQSRPASDEEDGWLLNCGY
jgi:dipeptidyl aminopeptidase/acylaminoacyl peptidase